MRFPSCWVIYWLHNLPRRKQLGFGFDASVKTCFPWLESTGTESLCTTVAPRDAFTGAACVLDQDEHYPSLLHGAGVLLGGVQHTSRSCFLQHTTHSFLPSFLQPKLPFRTSSVDSDSEGVALECSGQAAKAAAIAVKIVDECKEGEPGVQLHHPNRGGLLGCDLVRRFKGFFNTS